MWIKPHEINLERVKNEVVYNNFDSLVNNYSYYNCNSEMGNYISYYVKEV